MKLKDRIKAAASDMGFDDPKDLLEFLAGQGLEPTLKGHRDALIRSIRTCNIKLKAVKAVTRWAPCEVDPNDEDGPVFQGFLTDPEGTWVRWDDIKEALK